MFVFGAQYERGEAVTPFLDLRPSWVPQSMVNRYDLRRITFLPENRVAIWRAGLDIARESPWFGVGWARLAPLLLATALLNTLDLTLFEPPVFVPAVLAVAFWSGRSGAFVGSSRR